MRTERAVSIKLPNQVLRAGAILLEVFFNFLRVFRSQKLRSYTYLYLRNKETQHIAIYFLRGLVKSLLKMSNWMFIACDEIPKRHFNGRNATRWKHVHVIIKIKKPSTLHAWRRLDNVKKNENNTWMPRCTMTEYKQLTALKTESRAKMWYQWNAFKASPSPPPVA